VSAADDPTGTVRRGVTDSGFWFYIKFDQPPGEPCWELYDAYCSMAEYHWPHWLTDDQMDKENAVVAYVPLSIEEWAEKCGFGKPDDDQLSQWEGEGGCSLVS